MGAKLNEKMREATGGGGDSAASTPASTPSRGGRGEGGGGGSESREGSLRGGGDVAARLAAVAAAAKAKDDAQFVKLPIASAKKLRFYDNADLAEIIARHLEEKRSILDDNARVLRALEDATGGSMAALAKLEAMDAASAGGDGGATAAAAVRARKTEDGVNRVMLVAAGEEIKTLRGELEELKRRGGATVDVSSSEPVSEEERERRELRGPRLCRLGADQGPAPCAASAHEQPRGRRRRRS